MIPDKKYYTIGEISNYVDIKPHILRYWENEFRIIKPIRKEGGGRRYTKKDLDQIMKIKDLIYIKKYSILGAKKELLREERERKKKYKLDGKTQVKEIKIFKDIRKDLNSILRTLT